MLRRTNYDAVKTSERARIREWCTDSGTLTSQTSLRAVNKYGPGRIVTENIVLTHRGNVILYVTIASICMLDIPCTHYFMCYCVSHPKYCYVHNPSRGASSQASRGMRACAFTLQATRTFYVHTYCSNKRSWVSPANGERRRTEQTGGLGGSHARFDVCTLF